MSEIAARLRADQIASRKAADKDRTLVLGTVLASLKNRELELGHVPADGLPFTVIIDKDQRVAAVYFGAVADADLRPVLTSLVAES